MRHLYTLLAILAFSCGHTFAKEWTGTVNLTLDAALVWADRSTSPASLELHAEGNQFARGVTAYSADWDMRLHMGTITQQQVDANTAELHIRLSVSKAGALYGGPTARAGLLDLKLNLQRHDQEVSGSFTGNWQPADDKTWQPIAEPAVKVVGKVKGILSPGIYLAKAKTGHPRLLFTKKELPEIQRRLKTPEGQRLLARLEELLKLDRGGFGWGSGTWQRKAGSYVEAHFAVGHALMYQITGKKEHADRARLLTRLAMAGNGGEWGGWAIYFRTGGVALTYDLAYDAWDETFRRECQEWLYANSDGRGSTVDMHFEGQNAAGAGLAALAVLGDAYVLSPEPLAPEKAPTIAPVANLNRDGAPVVTFSGSRPKTWLVSGPYYRGPDSNRDFLTAIGGRDKAQPAADSKVTDAGRRYQWKLVGNHNFGLYKFDPGGFEMVDAEAAAVVAKQDGYDSQDNAQFGWIHFYTVLDNTEPRTIRVEPNGWCAQYGPPMPLSQVRMWIAGKEVHDQEVVRLERGLYPVMIECPVKGQIVWNPVIENYDQARYEELLAAWKIDRAAWQQGGKAAPHVADNLRAMIRFTRLHMQQALGERGFPREGSNFMDTWYSLLPFAAALKHTTAFDLSATSEGSGLPWIVPLQIWTEPRFTRHDWSHFHWRSLGFKDLMAPQYQAVLRWSIDQREDQGIFLPADVLFQLAGAYPWDVEPKSPVEAQLPLVLSDERLGGYVLRSGWKPTDYALIVQGQAGAPRTSVTTGDFTLLGGPAEDQYLGMDSAGGGFFRPPCLTDAEQPSVLRVTRAIPTRGGKVVHADLKSDGSGVVSLRQDYWVKGEANEPHGSPKHYDAKDLGIRHLRSLAIDYSGKSGAPVLLVVADHVQGCTAEHTAYLQLNGKQRSPYIQNGQTFTITHSYEKHGQKKSTTVVSHLIPTGNQPPVIEPRGSQQRWSGMVYVDRPAEHKEASNSSEQAERLYLMVVTVQDGEAPPVKSQGTSLKTMVTVGQRTVRFDGTKVVIE
jgi:hypothetical protein